MMSNSVQLGAQICAQGTLTLISKAMEKGQGGTAGEVG